VVIQALDNCANEHSSFIIVVKLRYPLL